MAVGSTGCTPIAGAYRDPKTSFDPPRTADRPKRIGHALDGQKNIGGGVDHLCWALGSCGRIEYKISDGSKSLQDVIIRQGIEASVLTFGNAGGCPLCW